MKATTRSGLVIAALSLASMANAADQTHVGAGNPAAATLALQSPIVTSARTFLTKQANTLQDQNLREQTLDAIDNPKTCIKHRANLDATARQAILQKLLDAGLVDPNDGGSFPGGLITGVYPPVLNDNSACPQLPMPFYAAPASVYHGHHSYPGGLPVHESNNDIADVHLADEYREVFGYPEGPTAAAALQGFPTIDHDVFQLTDEQIQSRQQDIYIDQDIIERSAPLARLGQADCVSVACRWFRISGTELRRQRCY